MSTYTDALMQLGESAKQPARGDEKAQNTWLDAYGQNNTRNWSEYFQGYKDNFKQEQPKGFQHGGYASTFGDPSGSGTPQYRFMLEAQQKQFQDMLENQQKQYEEQLGGLQGQLQGAGQNDYQSWMQNYWQQQQTRDDQFYNYMANMLQQHQQTQQQQTQQQQLEEYLNGILNQIIQAQQPPQPGTPQPGTPPPGTPGPQPHVPASAYNTPSAINSGYGQNPLAPGRNTVRPTESSLIAHLESSGVNVQALQSEMERQGAAIGRPYNSLEDFIRSKYPQGKVAFNKTLDVSHQTPLMQKTLTSYFDFMNNSSFLDRAREQRGYTDYELSAVERSIDAYNKAISGQASRMGVAPQYVSVDQIMSQVRPGATPQEIQGVVMNMLGGRDSSVDRQIAANFRGAAASEAAAKANQGNRYVTVTGQGPQRETGAPIPSSNDQYNLTPSGSKPTNTRPEPRPITTTSVGVVGTGAGASSGALTPEQEFQQWWARATPEDKAWFEAQQK